MNSLHTYLGRVYKKAYIGKYPPTIINLDELKEGLFLEIGPGSGNDLVWLLQNGSLPHRISSLEPDSEAYMGLTTQLYEQFTKMLQEGMPLDKVFSKPEEVIERFSTHILALSWVHLHLPIDIRNPIYAATKSFDYVYANNTLHCLDDTDGIYDVLSQAYNHLKASGVFFGRMLSDKIDSERLAAIEGSQDENHVFALDTVKAIQEGVLVGLPPKELEQMAQGVGFSNTYTELREHQWKPTTDFYFRFEK